MKRLYKYFLILIVIVALIYSGNLAGQIKNEDLKTSVVYEAQRIIISPYASITTCDGKPYKSYGFPTTNINCLSDQYCKDHWPDGVSYQIRDTRAVCCLAPGALGECGEFI